MKIEQAIAQILSACPWISKDEILNRLEKERHRTGGLISDEALLKMIAAEFGCTTSKSETSALALSLKDLISGLNDVTAVGRILAIFPPKSYEKATKGRLVSLLVADKSGALRVVLWNDKATLVESGKLKVGGIVRFMHGYTRADPSGNIELHLGENGEVETDPHGVQEKNYPGISKFATKIGDINKAQTNKRVNITGQVKKMFPSSTFERQDSSKGKVMRFILDDDTGEIPIVVWNEKVDELEKMLEPDLEMQIVNARIKKAMNEGLEVNIDSAAYVGPLTQTGEFSKIADLKEGQGNVNVEGEVVTKPLIRNVKTSREENLTLASFELKDETGKIWVSAWRRHADFAHDLKPGIKIVIKNAYVKKGFAEQLEISTRNVTSIAVIE